MQGSASRSRDDNFDDRFPKPQFKDRFPTASESLEQQATIEPARRTTQRRPATVPYRVASLAPTVPYQRPPHEDQTTLVSLKSSAFPYFGNNPRTDEPFLNVSMASAAVTAATAAGCSGRTRPSTTTAF